MIWFVSPIQELSKSTRLDRLFCPIWFNDWFLSIFVSSTQKFNYSAWWATRTHLMGHFISFLYNPILELPDPTWPVQYHSHAFCETLHMREIYLLSHYVIWVTTTNILLTENEKIKKNKQRKKEETLWKSSELNKRRRKVLG